MGQRHQIFIRVANPAKFANTESKASLEKEFGKEDTTMLVFHNQWLYGLSALGNALNVLKFASQFTVKEKTTKDGNGGYSNPMCPKYISSYLFKGVEKWVNTIAFIMNYNPVSTSWRDAGVDSSFYIGKEDTGIRNDFTMGDNNDGITIIDTINNKYCFMNIFDFEYDVERHGIYSLPVLQPVDARRYAAAYYGETIETCSTNQLDESNQEANEKVVIQHAKTNAKLAKKFSKFEVLTIPEIKAMFPKFKFPKKDLVVSI